MRKRVVLILLVGIISISGIGFLIGGQRVEETLHHLLHQPVVARVMLWVGLSKEVIVDGKKIYWCPMHPQVHRDKPGACPICNMQLVEKNEEATATGGDDGALEFTSRQLQQAGVRYATVKRLKLTRQIQTSGRVAVDERLLKTISVWAPGKSRIERLYANVTGMIIGKGQPLISVYNPDLINTLEEYRMLLQGGAQRMVPLLRSVAARLSRWGIGDAEIKKIGNNKKAIDNITINSPISGTVIERLVSEGQYVTEGKALLKLADLSSVWIYGDIYENELPLINIGMPVDVSVQGKTIKGKIDFIDPVLQNDSRTVKVRFEVANKNGYLKPGMYTSLRIDVSAGDVLAIPASAALFTGRRVIVFVSEGEGTIFPVEVKLGRKWFYAQERNDDKTGESLFRDEERYHEVLSGVDEDEQVVTSANFLISAEAQLQGALEKLAPSELAENNSAPDNKK